jgi:NADP-dependent alcohol dehydrogenase
MIGHEITALLGLNHAQTLPIIPPTMMSVRRESKHAKLLQYAERVWHFSESTKILASKRPSKIPAHFSRASVCLRAYSRTTAISSMLAQFKSHDMPKIG